MRANLSTQGVPAAPQQRSLRRHLAEHGGRLDVAEALELAAATVAALAPLHARERVHGDLRPDNLLIGEGPGRVALIGLPDEADEPADGEDGEARQATAYSAAAGLLRCGIALLPERAWDEAYDLGSWPIRRPMRTPW